MVVANGLWLFVDFIHVDLFLSQSSGNRPFYYCYIVDIILFASLIIAAIALGVSLQCIPVLDRTIATPGRMDSSNSSTTPRRTPTFGL